MFRFDNYKDLFLFEYFFAKKNIRTAIITIAAKKHAREKKNMEFNAVAMLTNEFSEALKSIAMIPKETTLQDGRAYILLKHDEGPHFMLVDMEIKNGRISFFIMDAASTKIADNVCKEIQNYLPNAVIYACKPSLQKEPDYCFVFAFSYAEIFSKLDQWHHYLSSLSLIQKEGIYQVERSHLPPDAMKLSESSRAIENYLANKDEITKKSIVNKRQHNLENHYKFFAKENSDFSFEYTYHKENSYKKMLNEYLNEKSYTHFLDAVIDNINQPAQCLLEAIKILEPTVLSEDERQYSLLQASIALDADFLSIKQFLNENPNALKKIPPEKCLLIDIVNRRKNYINLGIIEFLLQQGVGPNGNELMSYAEKENPKLLELLIKYGTNQLSENNNQQVNRPR